MGFSRHMSQLKRLRDAAVTEKTPLADLLRMCKVLGASLRSDRLRSWAHQELNGYGTAKDLPEYRVFPTLVKLRMRNLAGSRTIDVGKSAVIEVFGKEMAEEWTSARVLQNVAELANMPRDQNMKLPWPPEMVALLAEQMGAGARFAEAAWMLIPPARIVGILDIVRSRVLDLTIDLCEQDPDLAEHVEHAGAEVDRAKIETIVHQHITVNGDNATLATAGGVVSSNTGLQQGVNVGRGSAAVFQSEQNAQPEDVFDAVAFEKELTSVLHMLVDRVEEIEDAQYLEAQQVLTSLRRTEFETAKTLADVRTMLEDLWDESMKKKYGNLSKILGEDGALAQILKLAPSLVALLGAIAA